MASSHEANSTLFFSNYYYSIFFSVALYFVTNKSNGNDRLVVCFRFLEKKSFTVFFSP